MDTRELVDVAAARAAELPGTALAHPFGPEPDVYQVAGKMFMLVSVRDGHTMLTLKARPADAQVLRDAFPEVTPGYHMNKMHWISIAPDGALDSVMLRDIITESYLLVVAGLPRAQRPVNPDTFGQASVSD